MEMLSSSYIFPPYGDNNQLITLPEERSVLFEEQDASLNLEEESHAI
jgi:hypothetical protein